jgi:hypothetical protein
MPDLSICFKDFPPLLVQLDNNEVAHQWKKLFSDNYSRQMPMCRSGEKKYTLAYLNELVAEANEKLDWNYSTSIASADDTVKLHKNIEQICANGFKNIPSAYDNLIHEMHFCIHAIESSAMLAPVTYTEPTAISTPVNKVQPSMPTATPTPVNKEQTSVPTSFLQIEWFNDDGFALDPSFKFKLNMEVGDIKLQNPFVGHGPLQIYRYNDWSKVFQTCRFHDFVRPGINLLTKVRDNTDILDGSYEEWWQTNATDFVARHGMKKIWHYTGHPVIGRTLNVSDVIAVLNHREDLIFEKVIIH